MATLEDSINVIFNSFYRVKNNLHGYDSDLRDLSGITTVFERAGIAVRGKPTVVVTGSKGKGSTSILCAAFLQEMGYKVGLVTSPHLIAFRERIRINGVSIPEKAFIERIMALAPLVAEVDASLTHGYISPTGVILAAAMQYFYDEGVTAIVLEAGRGGRFDDVKIIQNRVACLTPIMNEHLDKLGPTIREVAWHKAGIIKPDSVVVSAPQTAEVLPILADEVVRQSAQALLVGKGITYQQDFDAPYHQHIRVQSTALGLNCTIPLNNPAHYLGLNAALGLASAATLVEPDDDQISEIGSLSSSLRFPGRCDRVNVHPAVFVDGAINRESAASLLESVAPYLTHPTVLITALPEDKDYPGFLETIMPRMDHTIITTASNVNLTFTMDVWHTAHRLDENAIHQPDVNAALQQAVELAGPDGFILAAGTQSFVRDALIFWKQDLDSLWESRPESF